MFIKTLTLKDHPLITDIELTLSLPNANKDGSGINYIVGKCGSGKTKLLETLFFLAPSTGINNMIPRMPIDKSIYQAILRSDLDKMISEKEQRLFQDFTVTTATAIKSDLLYKSFINRSRNQAGKSSEALHSMDRFEFSYPKGFANSGSGEARYNALVNKLRLIDPKKVSVICIDEPEAFMDPLLQISLLKEIAFLARTIQIFVATHSPYFIDWNYLSNGASIFKTNRIENTTTVGSFCDSQVATAINNVGRRSPQLNGAESKNIFFSEKVLVVEGHEDVGLIEYQLRKEMIDHDFTYFGYGAGGKNRIYNILKLCHGLNISKVVALFDNSPKTNNSEFEDCKAEFRNYKILCLLAEDIRDKYDRQENKIKGAFMTDSDGTCELRDDELGWNFSSTLAQLIDFFKDESTR